MLERCVQESVLTRVHLHLSKYPRLGRLRKTNVSRRKEGSERERFRVISQFWGRGAPLTRSCCWLIQPAKATTISFFTSIGGV